DNPLNISLSQTNYTLFCDRLSSSILNENSRQVGGCLMWFRQLARRNDGCGMRGAVRNLRSWCALVQISQRAMTILAALTICFASCEMLSSLEERISNVAKANVFKCWCFPSGGRRKSSSSFA